MPRRSGRKRDNPVDAAEEETTTRRSTRRRSKEDEPSVIEKKTQQHQRRSKRKHPRRESDAGGGNSGDDDDDEAAVAVAANKKTRRSTRGKSTTRSAAVAKDEADQKIMDSDDEPLEKLKERAVAAAKLKQQQQATDETTLLSSRRSTRTSRSSATGATTTTATVDEKDDDDDDKSQGTKEEGSGEEEEDTALKQGKTHGASSSSSQRARSNKKGSTSPPQTGADVAVSEKKKKKNDTAKEKDHPTIKSADVPGSRSQKDDDGAKPEDAAARSTSSLPPPTTTNKQSTCPPSPRNSEKISNQVGKTAAAAAAAASINEQASKTAAATKSNEGAPQPTATLPQSSSSSSDKPTTTSTTGALGEHPATAKPSASTTKPKPSSAAVATTPQVETGDGSGAPGVDDKAINSKGGKILTAAEPIDATGLLSQQEKPPQATTPNVMDIAMQALAKYSSSKAARESNNNNNKTNDAKPQAASPLIMVAASQQQQQGDDTTTTTTGEKFDTEVDTTTKGDKKEDSSTTKFVVETKRQKVAPITEATVVRLANEGDLSDVVVSETAKDSSDKASGPSQVATASSSLAGAAADMPESTMGPQPKDGTAASSTSQSLVVGDDTRVIGITTAEDSSTKNDKVSQTFVAEENDALKEKEVIPGDSSAADDDATENWKTQKGDNSKQHGASLQAPDKTVDAKTLGEETSAKPAAVDAATARTIDRECSLETSEVLADEYGSEEIVVGASGLMMMAYNQSSAGSGRSTRKGVAAAASVKPSVAGGAAVEDITVVAADNNKQKVPGMSSQTVSATQDGTVNASSVKSEAVSERRATSDDSANKEAKKDKATNDTKESTRTEDTSTIIQKEQAELARLAECVTKHDKVIVAKSGGDKESVEKTAISEPSIEAATVSKVEGGALIQASLVSQTTDEKREVGEEKSETRVSIVVDSAPSAATSRPGQAVSEPVLAGEKAQATSMAIDVSLDAGDDGLIAITEEQKVKAMDVSSDSRSEPKKKAAEYRAIISHHPAGTKEIESARKREAEENEVLSSKRQRTEPPLPSAILEEGRAKTESMLKREKENVVKKSRLNLERIKVMLFCAGSRVHQVRGYEQRFAEYWSALSMRLDSRLSDTKLIQCRETLDSFLKTKTLRKLHNKLIMGAYGLFC